MEDMTVGIVGSGTMGAGIAQVFAVHEHPVILVDVAAEPLDRGLGRISASLRRRVEKGDMSEQERERALERIRTATHMRALSPCTLVVEAVTEDAAVKTQTLKQVDAVVSAQCLIATNTSTLSVAGLAASVSEPGRFVGMHFMNPAPAMQLVEVISGPGTSAETAAAAVKAAEGLGKTPVLVKDSPGFVLNRLLIPMINEAICVLEGGVAPAEAIDTCMKLGANHPMGPLALADLIGLDVCLRIMEVLHADLADPKYAPSPLLQSMVAAGRLGRKTGAGFYTYGG
jgi:3-hydroxybutyryl-CoA dehydrogenase